jgi:Protein of unknown function (DUF3995)
VRSEATHVTALTLIGLAALHVAWGRGSSFPLADRDDLAEAVVGTSIVPGPLPCFGVAAALLVAASAVQNRPQWPTGPRGVALTGIAGVFGGRGLLGLAGKTSVVSPGSDGVPFRRLDRRFYAPLCLGLAAGVLSADRRPEETAAGVPRSL